MAHLIWLAGLVLAYLGAMGDFGQPRSVETRVFRGAQIEPTGVLINRVAPAATVQAAATKPTPVQQIQFDILIARIDEAAFRKLPVAWLDHKKVSRDEQFGGVKLATGQLVKQLRQMRETGLLTLLAEPRIITMSGRPATFVSNGNQCGIVVNVVPVVLANGNIHVEVKVDMDERANSRATSNLGTNREQMLPTSTRCTQTNLVLNSGETVACSGLSSNPRSEYVFITARLVNSTGTSVMHAHHQEPAPRAVAPLKQMTIDEVIRLSKAGAAEDIIVRQMAITQSRFRPSTEDVIRLLEHGVSPQVVRIIQEKSTTDGHR